MDGWRYWTERNGVAWVIAYILWFRAGLLPVPAQRVGRLIPGERSGSPRESGRADVGVRAGIVQQIRGPIWIGRSQVTA